ncbi:MAG: FAD-binding oxidoreductase [Thermoleophilia bacterium]|nr:FAD-binding oxidoreductase [Thermoleophilia bacterium]
MDAAGLVRRLSGHVSGEIRADPATLELYSADASLYRRRPAAVLRAAHADDLAAAVAACAETGMPLTMRGAGTSLAGQAVGRGLVVDCSALSWCAVDPDARVARVGPGAVLDDLNAAAGVHGLVFGPDVATASRATLGGMIANNSAGARSVVHGLTADAVAVLEVVLADGTRATLRRGAAAPAVFEGCRPLAGDWEGPSLLRRVSGYNLDALAGDDPDWPRLLCGSEGTLAVTTGAELHLEPRPMARGLALLPFPDVDAALDAVVDLLADGPSAIELLDEAMLDPANRARATASLTGFGDGVAAMLVVEHSGDPDDVRRRVLATTGAAAVLDPEAQAGVWAVRRSGIARAMRGLGPDRPAPADAKPLAFIEDPAVPPARLAAFAREVRRLLAEEGVPASWYGHASVGCLHIRPVIDLRAPGAAAQVRRIAEAVAGLVVAHGGSLSGEHGDGRLRGELLPCMYPPRTIAAFRRLKDALDPAGILNPGVIVRPEPLDAGLRLLESPPRRSHATVSSFAPQGGLARAAEACNGNGACRARTGVMCPSFQALGDERHATRGRAVLFRAALEGRLPGGLAGDGLHEALSLCLSCKACAAECPASVDMARLKVEALAHRHARYGVPLRARAFGDVRRLMAFGARLPAPVLRAGARIAGWRLGRPVPVPVRPRGWGRTYGWGDMPRVALLADTFTTHLHPRVGSDAVMALTACGVRPEVVDAGCCGRPLLSQGLADAARRRLSAMLDRLAPLAIDGVPIVVLEPSCWSMLLDDAPKLLPDDPRARWVADAVETFEQAVLRLGLTLPPAPRPGTAVVHPHCHARALGAGDHVLELARLVPGLEVRPSGAGCCGMAGSFGYEHPELSRRIAEDRLLPAARAADVVIAHGTSCRQQVGDLAGTPTLHPAELIARSLGVP